jgi:hypothetical protein
MATLLIASVRYDRTDAIATFAQVWSRRNSYRPATMSFSPKKVDEGRLKTRAATMRPPEPP